MVSVNGLESESNRKLIDELNHLGLGTILELPQIAVMGDTSSGKSSLLSAISGFEFPSSDQLTTRCPTQIIMTKDDSGFSARVSLHRYDHTSTEKNGAPESESLTSIDQVKNAIEKFTIKLMDEGQVISDDSIVIEARGPELPNLTLIDLPGFVRTVHDGEDESMIPRVRALVKRFLDQKRTIILAVVPANVDVHNSEILQSALEVDPEGDRTFAVITKPDLVDAGAEGAIIKLLNNQTKKLKLGYHSVLCRGQKDLNENMSIQKGIKKEEIFWNISAQWKAVPRDLLGIPKLREKLSRRLEELIRDSLPFVQNEITSQKNAVKSELESLGLSMEDATARRIFFTGKVDSISYLIHSGIKGLYHND